MTETKAYVDFDDYLPCRLAAVSTMVLRSVASVFEDCYDISIPEWKVMAAVARHPRLSAVEVAQNVGLDTVAVSRAVTRLIDAGRICRQFGKEDRRRSILELSEEGRKLYEQLTPMAARLEADLLEELSDDEIHALEMALKVLSAKSRAFQTATELGKTHTHRPVARRPAKPMLAIARKLRGPRRDLPSSLLDEEKPVMFDAQLCRRSASHARSQPEAVAGRRRL